MPEVRVYLTDTGKVIVTDDQHKVIDSSHIETSNLDTYRRHLLECSYQMEHSDGRVANGPFPPESTVMVRLIDGPPLVARHGTAAAFHPARIADVKVMPREDYDQVVKEYYTLPHVCRAKQASDIRKETKQRIENFVEQLKAEEKKRLEQLPKPPSLDALARQFFKDEQ